MISPRFYPDSMVTELLRFEQDNQGEENSYGLPMKRVDTLCCRVKDVELAHELNNEGRYVPHALEQGLKEEKSSRRGIVGEDKNHTFLGLLAKIKCSICSYQFNI